MTDEAIRFENVTVEAGGDEILRGVSGSVGRGRVAAIIGPSGAGKSSLLSLCNMLRSPSSGKVYVLGREVREWDVRSLRRQVGMVFQAATIFPGTVEQNLAYGLRLHGQVLSDAGSLLEDIGLSRDLLGRKAEDLSGGQKQRVALGRVLAMEPEILLLDEVTSALDVHAKQEVERTILHLHEKLRATLFWVTHDLAQAKRVADDIWFMAEGRLIEVGSTASFFAAPSSDEARAFLEQMTEEMEQ
ncbi:ABC transporter ATP-binding protein [Alicyclobacillus dauci]|uniref:Phosphate ABC transporter ATP-binding protein n=1 Tax=Alicyclobacillus dauci TaxID=1475485 RepID=A0ABY6Z2F0_9BACL|nr:phosphate ABC transporter ATP-binding protein [Alicyclobacillus dauci]WAH36924.1 phosphate ABC transporter ATP-binding protein [Alicyclobacillus dauci]